MTRILDSAINKEILWLTALKPTQESATRTADENHIAGDRVQGALICSIRSRTQAKRLKI